uniref:Uncharacterized protein n=1 Tax=Chlamydomonas euryale TaxID=1486919 RepID=A0A7R9YUQ7_9CHLO|mmetsp:Transcript_27803/g.82428  ORF Transcript_27803/g.82428 Transcript_27803/m.82428 type:complete len:175 (+) Transcript_27803:789-1313(+)
MENPTAADALHARFAQSPMVTTDVFGIPRSVDRGTGSMAGKTNKKDGWASFQTADIHRVNRHIPAKGAGALYDNVHAASDAPTVWEWEAQSQAGRAGAKDRRVDVYPAYSGPAAEKPAVQVASSAPLAGAGALGMERWLGRTSAGLSRDASQDLDRSRSGAKPPMADLSMPYSA